MDSRKSRFWPMLTLILVGALAAPVGLESQCNTTGSPYVNTSIAPYVTVRKYLTAPANCVRAPVVNASFCQPNITAPPPGPLVVTLSANAHTGNTASPYCAWTCTCGTALNPGVRIDGSDGLPVELMDFSVEG